MPVTLFGNSCIVFLYASSPPILTGNMPIKWAFLGFFTIKVLPVSAALHHVIIPEQTTLS